MKSLSLENVSKSYGAADVLKNISLEAEEGEFVVLLGRSGCGKSTLLHAIAGLHPINKGNISIYGRVVNDIPTRQRDIAMVFQSYALYPNMTVADNIGFPLKMRGLQKPDITGKVLDVARTLQLEALLDRLPRQLSGGQRQAIGRSLVRDPKIFLFDEPLSNLDASLRVEMRAEIKQLHQRIGKTIVYVTHDQIEAMTLATKIVILNKGEIQQIGTPAEVYHHPANLFVARFIGSPAISLLECTVEGRELAETLVCGKDEHQLNLPVRAADKLGHGKHVLLGLRPEHIRLGRHQGAAARASVGLVEPTGPEDVVFLDIGGQKAIARFPTNAVVQGQIIDIDLDVSRAVIFDAVSNQRLAANFI
ncbi:ABC transporter ATP-binding protein [Pararhizobium capsulatum]|nr:ATP-binding cassette domain-containing protein [Pararhizobium capsulatum]